MPNHVTNCLRFSVEHADRVFAAVCDESGLILFENLIPQPPQLYRGNLRAEDEEDFGCNWYKWNSKNWGTKWGAYKGSTSTSEQIAEIRFATAWTVPYPIISAFNNRFQIPFEHRYIDEMHNFWGIETWGKEQRGERIVRREKRRDNEGDRAVLDRDLLGRSDEGEEEVSS